MAQFIIRILQYAWKYGKSAIDKVVAWVRRNWEKVKKWIDAGLSITAIIEIILRILGIG